MLRSPVAERLGTVVKMLFAVEDIRELSVRAGADTSVSGRVLRAAG
jgi:hypothetical protein